MLSVSYPELLEVRKTGSFSCFSSTGINIYQGICQLLLVIYSSPYIQLGGKKNTNQQS